MLLHVADSLSQIAERISLDFSVTEEKVNEQIENLTGPFTPEEKSGWEQKGWLEWRTIDGDKKSILKELHQIWRSLKNSMRKQNQKTANAVDDPEKIFRLKHTGKVVKLSEMRSDTVLPVTMKITYTITVHPDVVPEGEKNRVLVTLAKKSII